MSRRPAPRPAAGAMRAALSAAAPRTRLAAVQSAWVEAVGERVAGVAEPVAERGEQVIVACSDPVWAQELDLMQGQLLARLRDQIGDAAPDSLRFRVEDTRK